MRLLYWLIGAAFCIVGCSNSNAPDGPAARPFSTVRSAPPAGDNALAQAPDKKPAEKGQPDNAARPAPAEPLPRKIIYNADVSLVVQDFEKAADELLQLVGRLQGFVAKSDIQGSAGSPRSAHWRIRLPVARYNEFLQDVVKLGVPQRNTADSQDVTDEYYDLEARIKNKRVEEERLLRLLEKSTDHLDEVLKVERELSRVRGEIEQMQGRMRVLANLTELTTITVTMQEIKDYVPPQAPTFGGQASQTFSNSLDALASFGKGLALFAVGIAPWLPVIAVIVIPTWLLIRRQSTRQSVQTVLPAGPPTA